MSRSPTQPIDEIADGVRLNLLIQPRASVSEVAGLHDGRIRIRLAAPPVDGAANESLLKFLSKSLGVTRADLKIVSGATGRRKAVHVGGVSVVQARHSLLAGIR